MFTRLTHSKTVGGPKAPKDPTKKRPFFFIMQGKEIFGAPQPDGRGVQFLYMDCGRLIDAARLSGNIEDDYMLELLKSAQGFKTVVHSIGVSVSGRDAKEPVKFVLEMYPEHPGEKATQIKKELYMDGMETVINLEDIEWEVSDKEVGQIRFEFGTSGIQAAADVRFYLNQGFIAPVQPMEQLVDFKSSRYKKMISQSLLHAGNTARLEKVLSKAGSGENVTLSFIGGSITQGAGAIPINEKCYAKVFADEFQKRYIKGGKVNFIKAGVGGTPSELGMIRFERDVLRDYAEKPDLIVIEFAVNDEGDETKGVCYESLVRKALSLPWKPAVVLLFAVFSFDWNLQDRLGPVGIRYDLPMVSVLDAVTEQFKLLPEDGRVISKNQFFYDVYHPSNLGHQIMSDCLINLIDNVNESRDTSYEEDEKLPQPVIGGDFENVELLDKKELEALKKKYKITKLDAGSFDDVDKDIQLVEMDEEIIPRPEFPNNWAYNGKSSDPEPFVMSINCSKLLLVFKDSGSASFGTAQVFVDEKKIKDVNPLEVGWTHCNAVILFNEEKNRQHKVEIKMADGMNDKKFTILGFGVVR